MSELTASFHHGLHHVDMAESILAQTVEMPEGPEKASMLAAAQVHATLAVVFAQVETGGMPS